MTATLISLGFLCIFTLGSGFLSASETALFSLPPGKVRSFSHQLDKNKRRIARLVSRPRELLVTILMLNVFLNLLVQNVAASLFGEGAGWILNVGVPLALTLTFGEIIPKSIAFPNNEAIAKKVAPTISVAERVLRPLGRVVTSLTEFLARIFFFFLKNNLEISRKEMAHVVEGSKDTILSSDEADLIKGFLRLQDATVKEMMRPRDSILFYELSEGLNILTQRYMEKEVSQLPICEGDLENILGTLHASTFFLNKTLIRDANDVREFLSPPFFVPEHTPGRQLLRQFSERGESMAIVVDEYGSVTGLITREDLVEEVVGEITDRRDEGEDFRRVSRDVIIANGRMELADFNRLFDCQLESPNSMVTLGGWLTEAMGDIPTTGSHLVTEQFLFHVLSAEPQTVNRIYVRRLAQREGS